MHFSEPAVWRRAGSLVVANIAPRLEYRSPRRNAFVARVDFPDARKDNLLTCVDVSDRSAELQRGSKTFTPAPLSPSLLMARGRGGTTLIGRDAPAECSMSAVPLKSR